MTPIVDMAVIQPRYHSADATAYCNATNVPEVLGTTGAFMTTAVIAVLLRMYVRVKVLRFIGADDYVMLAATVMAIATFICFVGESRHGVGRHVKCIGASDYETLAHWQFYHSLWVMFGVVLVKISVALFLIRLAPRTAWKRFLWGAIAFLICFGLACAGTLIFACVPVAASWTFSLRKLPATKCFSASTFAAIGLFNSIVNICTDFLFALLPIPIIVRLQVNTRTKLTLAFVLSLGFVACAAGIVKAHLQATFIESPDPDWHDSFNVWNMIELCLGILAASLPALKPLFSSMLASTKTALGVSSGRSKGRTPASGGAYPGSTQNSGYRKHYDPRDIHEILTDTDVRDYRASASVTGGSRAKLWTEDFYPMEMAKLARAKSGYNVRITSRDMAVTDDRSSGWEMEFDNQRSDSEEQLHPGGIYKTMEITRTSERMQ